jgi:hypothetical protein
LYEISAWEGDSNPDGRGIAISSLEGLQMWDKEIENTEKREGKDALDRSRFVRQSSKMFRPPRVCEKFPIIVASAVCDRLPCVSRKNDDVKNCPFRIIGTGNPGQRASS